MRRPAVVVLSLALVVLAVSAQAAPRRARGHAPLLELSVGHSVYPQQPRIAAITLSVKATEFSGIAVYGDVGYGLGSENKSNPQTDGLVVGVSAGQKRARVRWGVQYHTVSREVQVVVRARLLGF